MPRFPDVTNPILHDIAATEHYAHSRLRVYPQNITSSPLVTADAAANTFGNWGEIVPLNTIPFPFHVVGFCVCQVSATTVYFAQFGYNTVNEDPGSNMECGEREFRIATLPLARATELLTIRGQGIPANSRVMARLKTASVIADTCNMFVSLSRHVEVSQPITLWPDYPW